MTSYRAVYEREPDGRWTVAVPQVPGCHTYGRTIEQARERVREALGLFVEDAKRAVIVDEVRLDAPTQKAVLAAQKLRAILARAAEEMVEAQVRAVTYLRKGLRLGHRDAGQILGMSHQRVQQLEKRLMARRYKRPGAAIGGAARPPVTVSSARARSSSSRVGMKSAAKKR